MLNKLKPLFSEHEAKRYPPIHNTLKINEKEIKIEKMLYSSVSLLMNTSVGRIK